MAGRSLGDEAQKGVYYTLEICVFHSEDITGTALLSATQKVQYRPIWRSYDGVMTV
jgi:hypothetical protein